MTGRDDDDSVCYTLPLDLDVKSRKMGKKGAKGAKKGKKSKKDKAAELAELQRLEEERLRLEEEERQRIEQERIRLEEEEKKRERLAQKAVDDAARLTKERAEDEIAKQELIDAIKKVNEKHAESELWNKVVACDALPDPNDEPDFNSFLSEWKGSSDYSDHVLDQCKDGESLLAQLDFLKSAAKEEMDDERLRWGNERCDAIFAITQQKIDGYSANLMVQADEAGNMVRSAIIKEHDSEAIKFAMWTSGHAKLKRTKLIEFADIGVTVDLPSTITMQNKNGMGLRLVYTAHDRFEQMNESALCSYGGVYNCEATELPLPSVMVNDWMIREVNDAFEHVQVRPYPGSAVDNAAVVQPIKLSWNVPDNILVDDHPSAGWWNNEKNEWSTQGIAEVKFDSETRELHLHTHTLQPLALLHLKKLDFPYLNWRVRTTGPDTATIRVVGSRLAVEIEIKDSLGRLISPQAPELMHLMSPMKPHILLWELRRSGINLMPNNIDAERIDLGLKENALEKFLHEQIASMVGSYEFAKSMWNIKRPASEGVFRIRPISSGSVHDSKEDASALSTWVVIGGTAEYVYVSKTKEDAGDNWDPDEPEFEDELRHTNLERALKQHFTNDRDEAQQPCTIMFREALRKTLNLLRVLTE